MATIRQKGPYQWHVQIRRKGFPYQTETFSTKKDAEAWAREIEVKMDRGTVARGSMDKRTTLGDLLRRYGEEVTAKRRGEASKKSENSRINRFLREEPDLYAYAVVNLTSELFEDYRNRRLTQFASRGKPGRRGQYKAVERLAQKSGFRWSALPKRSSRNPFDPLCA